MRILLPCNFDIKCSTISTSQSFRSLVKRGAQQPPSYYSFETSATQASFGVAIDGEGKVVHSGSSPHHWTFQNLTLHQLPTKKATLLAKDSNPF